MASRMQHGYLVLADISGFTSFIAETELEHAHDILSELLELMIGQLTSALSLIEVEGDAVYVCTPEVAIPHGETLLELFESTYAAFRDRVEAVRRRTTCQCNACRLIPSLDLKFITTCGDYILETIAGSSKPVGTAVNLVHRLAKNRVVEATGWRAYALFTEPTLEHMGVATGGMHREVEAYEHLGEITTYSLDLLSRYKERVKARRVFISPREADWAGTLEIAAPPAVVWDWLNDPVKHSLWDTRHSFYGEKNGSRRGVGTRNHCVHGKDNEHLQTILDWRPFDYFTEDDQGPKETKPSMVMTHQLEPTERGTRLHVNLKLQSPTPGAIKRTMCSMMMKFMQVEQTYRNMARMVEEEQAKLDLKSADSPQMASLV